MGTRRRRRTAADVARRQRRWRRGRDRPRARTRRAQRGHNLNRRRPRHGRRAALVLGGLAVLAIGLVGAALVADAMAVRRGLLAAEVQTDAAREALLSGDVPASANRLERARAELATPLARTGRPLWRVAERLPVIGDTFATVTAVVDTADAASGVGRRLITAASALVGEDARLEITASSDGRIDLGPVTSARAALANLDTTRLTRASARLRATVPGPGPAEVGEARQRLLDLADRVLAETGAASALVDVLPGFLGDDEPRRYLLALQNPAELRGTGGLIGFYAVLTAESGRFEMSRPDPFEVLDAVEGRRTTTPVDVPEDFAARYTPANAAGFLANANVDPDLPTVAPVLLDLYRHRTGQSLDGVVAIDPLGLQAIMQHVGPVDVPDGLPAPGLPDPVPADEIAETLMIRAYEQLGGDTPEREAYLRAFTVAAFERLFAGGWDALEVTPAVARTAVDGHLQVWSRVTAEQAAFERLRVGGALAPRTAAHDLLAVTANNAAGNKADVFTAHGISGLVQLLGTPDEPVRVADLTVTVRNPLPTEGMDDYFLQSASPGRGFTRGFVGPRGLNRTWLSFWMPDTSHPTGLVVDGVELEPSSSSIGGRRALDHVLEVPSSTTRSVTGSVVGPVTLERDGDHVVYRLTLHRQAKAVPDRLALALEALPGWRPVEVSLAGGGTGDGFGAHGEPGPTVTAEVEDDRVVVRGDMTRTIDLMVRMAPVR